ncbi:tubulin monoglycylase TTLL3-like isoform X2 [Leucoraja erinacea]|uniref:tubulin monoglycylase TTLL3-like isoform X2 n=1 Tax=Leucoraja erinaceus TaxID=7782 RepID=UPI00245536FB|nr:tubulin monoglycylase TTLL3-like isoform X2 [Leucoraja erinacea]
MLQPFWTPPPDTQKQIFQKSKIAMASLCLVNTLELAEGGFNLESKDTCRIENKMAGGSCPKGNVSEKQNESVQSMEGIRLKHNFKSQYYEAKKITKSPESWVIKDIKFHRSQAIAPEIKSDRLRNCKLLVEKAIKLKKIFTVFGPYPIIRQCLRHRGWLEKKTSKPPKSPQKREKITYVENDLDDGIGDSDGCDSDDKAGDEKDLSDDPDSIHDIVSRLLKNEMPHFLWTNGIDGQNLLKDQIFNHFLGAGSFTTKAGLCVNLRNYQWFHGVNPDNFFPRCYRIAVEDEKQSFIEDFRLTAARNILKWVVELKKATNSMHKDQENKEMTSNTSADEAFQREPQRKRGIVSVTLIETALRACEEYLNTMEHKDIDVSLDTPPAVTEKCWEEAIQQYYRVIHDGATIQNWNIYADMCEQMLQQLQKVNAQLKIEGMRNIWIVKPGAQSRGRGITCMDRLEQIMKLVYGHPTLFTDGKWVVQKYIEHPLLIYGTKFDLRQWFLVTDWNPVTVWFYKDCYLRFSTQAFSLENLDTAIHLCNNSIQKHYVTSPSRHPLVPKDNMWSSTQFKEYLSKNGFTNTWEDVISPGMKKAIVNTMQIMQDVVKPRKNSFELYGADFLLGEDFKPWLIEINCSPTMSASTSVTAALCSSVQEDTIKVVIDRKNEKTCDTGQFELLYKQNTTNIPLYLGINLLVEGSSIKKPPLLTQRNTSSGMHLSQNVQRPIAAKVLNHQNSLNLDENKSAKTENAKNKDASKVSINPSKPKHSFISRKHEFANHLLNPNNFINAKNPFMFNSGNGKNHLIPSPYNVGKMPLKLTHSSNANDSSAPNKSNTNHCPIPQNSNNTKHLTPSNCSTTNHTSSGDNCGVAEIASYSNDSSIKKDSLNVVNSSITTEILNSKNSNTANNPLNPNISRNTENTLNATDPTNTNSQLQTSNVTVTNNSPFPIKSTNKYPFFFNNSSNVNNTLLNPITSKSSNFSQDSNNILQDHNGPNHYSKCKTRNIFKNHKAKNSHVSKNIHKIRNRGAHSDKTASDLSDGSALDSSSAKALGDLEETKNNTVDTAQEGATENVTKDESCDKVEQQNETSKLSKAGGNKGTGKLQLPPKTKFSQVSTSVRNLLLPGQQLLRDPFRVKLNYLSLDLLHFKDSQHPRASSSTDTNKIRALHEKSIPLRYSYNTPRLQLTDTNIPQLHITGLHPQFKASSDINNKYIETQQNATINLMNRHLLTSYFPLFQ